MFYCNPCGTVRNWPESMAKSHGPCEICGRVGPCNDVPSSALPEPPDLPDCPKCEGCGTEPCSSVPWCSDPDHGGTCTACGGSGVTCGVTRGVL